MRGGGAKRVKEVEGEKLRDKDQRHKEPIDNTLVSKNSLRII